MRNDRLEGPNGEQVRRNREVFHRWAECGNFNAVAREYGLTPERVRQIVRREGIMLDRRWKDTYQGRCNVVNLGGMDGAVPLLMCRSCGEMGYARPDGTEWVYCPNCGRKVVGRNG